jgi:hypothetical protein
MTATPNVIADAIANAPAWALLGLTEPASSLRADAARELADCIWEAIGAEPSQAIAAEAAGQLALTL